MPYSKLARGPDKRVNDDIDRDINEIYKKTKDSKLMETMKNITAKKRKIEKRLKGSPLA